MAAAAQDSESVFLKHDQLTDEYAPAPPGYDVCPYVRSHVIAIIRMDTHVSKCRANYKEKVAAKLKGTPIPILTCKYDFTHKIIAPELLHHEARCGEGNKVPGYLLTGISKDSEKNLQPQKMSEEDERDLYGGFQIGTFVGAETFGQVIPIESIRYPKTYRIRREALRKSAAQGNSKAKGGIIKKIEEGKSGSRTKGNNAPRASTSDTFNAQALVDRHSKQSTDTGRTFGKLPGGRGGTTPRTSEEKDEDESDWESNPNIPPYDFMKSLRNPSKPMNTYPIGLTKSQRREYRRWNSKWIANLRAAAKVTEGALTDAQEYEKMQEQWERELFF